MKSQDTQELLKETRKPKKSDKNSSNLGRENSCQALRELKYIYIYIYII